MVYLTDGKTDTSRAAGESVRAHAERMEQRVYEAIRSSRDGLACFEIEDRLGMIHQTASARTAGLKRKGKIRDSGRRRITHRGRQAEVLVAT